VDSKPQNERRKAAQRDAKVSRAVRPRFACSTRRRVAILRTSSGEAWCQGRAPTTLPLTMRLRIPVVCPVRVRVRRRSGIGGRRQRRAGAGSESRHAASSRRRSPRRQPHRAVAQVHRLTPRPEAHQRASVLLKRVEPDHVGATEYCFGRGVRDCFRRQAITPHLSRQVSAMDDRRASVRRHQTVAIAYRASVSSSSLETLGGRRGRLALALRDARNQPKVERPRRAHCG
jgi:hypothetical protein